MKHFLLASLALLFALAGCGAGGYRTGSVAKEMASGADSAPASARPQDDSGPAVRQASLVQRQVIRKAQLGVRVKNVEEAEKKATALVGQSGGYVEGTSSSDLAGANARITLTVRVPANKFDEILSGFSGLGVPVSKTISGEDVTAQLFDLDARLKTLAAEEETLRGFMKGARDLNTMMDVQRRITDVRTEIETIAGRRKHLGELAALSTITLSLAQSAEHAPIAPRDQNWALEAWGQATGSFMGLIRKLGTMAIWLAVCSPIWVPLLLLVRVAWRRMTARLATS